MSGLRVVPIVLALLCGGCGWHAEYASGPSGAPGPAQRGLAAINVPLLPERQGQLMRLALQERFERFGLAEARKYDLVVSFSITGEGLAIQQDNTSTYTRLIGIANWSLIAQTAQRNTLTSGFARTTDGFNILDNQYLAADLQNEAVQRRVANAVADRITEQLAAYFSRQQTVSAQTP